MDVIRPIFTYTDLTQLPEDGKRYEILEGDLAVSPSPNQKHQRCVWRIVSFFQLMEQAGYGQGYAAPFDVVFDEHNVTEPDVLFIRTERLSIVTEANVQGAPDLVVEVLSPSTRARDLGVKVHLYARFHVQEYWVADPDAETLTVYRLGADGYQQVGPLHDFNPVQSSLFPKSTLVVAELFRS
ncbi:MAG: Uma2 family endonuclease [Firmicutes bacterium]|jgi:Uma2 family endonuclease|nr:Uma2 family endonuclease [Bacillota bacterium]MCL5064906.1 Uma2 family endonuclease [Bacillota bacterium]